MLSYHRSNSIYFSELRNLIPPTTQNKIIPLEIRSPPSVVVSCSAWVHKKREKECTGLHWHALTLFFARTTLFCVMDGILSQSIFFSSSRVSRVGGNNNQIELPRLGPSSFSFMKMWRAAASKFTTVNYIVSTMKPKNQI